MKRALIVLAAAMLALSATAAALAGGSGSHRGGGLFGGLFGLDAGELQGWKDCLTEHGLAAPTRGTDGKPGWQRPSKDDLAKVRAAFEACRSSLPSAVQDAQKAFSSFRDCLEQQMGAAAPAQGAKPTGFDFSKVRRAFDACRSLLPQPVRAPLDAFGKYRDCLKEHGVSRGWTGAKPSDADRAKLKAAFDACRSLLPAPVRAAQDAFGKYRDCLKQHGVSQIWPSRGTKPSDADRAKLRAAFDACRPVLPALPHRGHLRFP